MRRLWGAVPSPGVPPNPRGLLRQADRTALPNGRHGTRDRLPVLRKALAESDEPRPARPKQAHGRIAASPEPRDEGDHTDATAVDGGEEENLPRSGGQGGVVQPHTDRFPPRDDDPPGAKLQNQVSPLALAGPHHADRHTPEPTDSPGRTSPPEQRDLVEAEPPGEANSTGQRNLEEADPPSDAETNPPGDVEMNPPGDAETDPPEQTDTPGQSDPAERGGLPGVDTPGQSDSAEQEDLPEVDPPTEADPPGETIRPDPSEEANPLEEAIDEVLQAAVDAAILAARPSDNQSGGGGGCGGGCGGGSSETGEEGRTPRRPRTLSELAAEWSDISVDAPETTEDPSTPRERRGRGRRWRRRRGERGRGNRAGDSEGRRVETPDQVPPSWAGRRQAPRPTPSQANPAASAASSSRPATTSDSQPRPRHWLTLAYEEVTDDIRKELYDFVRQSLEALGGNRIDWAQFEGMVGSLVDRVAAMCESNMDAQTTSRSVDPNQGWRWQQRRQRAEPRGETRQLPTPVEANNTAPEDQQEPGRHRGGHHNSRSRRHRTARQRYNGPEVQRVQRSFRRNRKRCVRDILEGENGHRCNIPAADLQTFFRNESSCTNVDIDNPPDWWCDGVGEPDPNAEWEPRPISPGEVKAQLKRLPSSSAPGLDRLPYKVWKAIDPEGVILARIFEVCRREQRVPSAWKKSTTILLYKNGDEAVPSNWRPISLQNAVYKIYAAIWERRLATWAGETGAISPSQKGFVPGEGCLEHSFLVRSMMEDARRRHRPLHLVWFDLKNAFGSIPHDLLWHSMRRLGVPEEAVSILMDVYQGSTYTVQTAEGATEEIAQERGVKQGCPISPLLFNLAIEGLVRGIQSSAACVYSFDESFEVKCLAYADDLAIAAASEEDVETMLARLEEFSRWAHLDFNVAK